MLGRAEMEPPRSNPSTPSDEEGPRPRIESLSDLVFGLALSIGAVFLIGNPPVTPGDLLADVAEFGFSFLILILVWLRYTRTMSVLRVEGPITLRLNLGLLFLVAIEPFLFNVAFAGKGSNGEFGDVSTIAYALDLGFLILIQGTLSSLAAEQLAHKKRAELAYQLHRESLAQYVTAAFFLVSTLPWFYFWEVLPGLRVRFVIWIVPFALARYGSIGGSWRTRHGTAQGSDPPAAAEHSPPAT